MNEENKTYARDYSHTHCWEQKNSPACGIPLEKHSQCCLCDVVTPMQETKQKECGMCCSLVPPRCINKDCVCHTETKQKWEEEFEYALSGFQQNIKLPLTAQQTLNEIEKLKKFISTLLSEDRAKTVEMVKSMERKRIKNFDTSYEVENANGYNEALDDIINLLNNRE